MMRETKIGAVVAGSFLAMAGGAFGLRWHQSQTPATQEPTAVAAAPAPPAPAEPTPAPATGSPTLVTPPAAPPAPAVTPAAVDPLNSFPGMPAPAAAPPTLPAPDLHAAPPPSLPVAPAPEQPKPANDPPPPAVAPPVMEQKTEAPQAPDKPKEIILPPPPEEKPAEIKPADPVPPPVAPAPEAPKPVEPAPAIPAPANPSPMPEFKPAEPAPATPKIDEQPKPLPPAVDTTPPAPPPNAARLETISPPKPPQALPDAFNAVQPAGAGRPMAPKPPASDSFVEEEYRTRAGDNYTSVSRRFYFTDKYAAALRQYNRDYPLASGAHRVDSPPQGTVVWIPPTRVLHRRYPHLIDGSEAAPSPAAMTPAVRPVASGMKTYKVRDNGETLQDIARRTLNNPNNWGAIYQLNPSLNPNPQVPISAGTILRLPKEAREP